MPHTTSPRSLRTLADGFLEAPIITSFTNIGYSARKRLHHWAPLDTYDLTGKVVVLTGASTGIGFELATLAAKNGYDILVVADEPLIEAAAEDFRQFGEHRGRRAQLDRPLFGQAQQSPGRPAPEQAGHPDVGVNHDAHGLAGLHRD